MKKLLIIVFIAGFVGLAFAFSPAKVMNSKEINKISVLDDSTKTKKKSEKKGCCGKTCKTKCSKSTTKETPKKVN
jgi:hypothetical protein